MFKGSIFLQVQTVPFKQPLQTKKLGPPAQPHEAHSSHWATWSSAAKKQVETKQTLRRVNSGHRERKDKFMIEFLLNSQLKCLILFFWWTLRRNEGIEREAECIHFFDLQPFVLWTCNHVFLRNCCKNWLQRWGDKQTKPSGVVYHITLGWWVILSNLVAIFHFARPTF